MHSSCNDGEARDVKYNAGKYSKKAIKQMQQTTGAALEKQIKRHIYGKPQSILIVFPPGMAAAALQEAEYLLSHLWFQNKFESKITVQKNTLRIDDIHLFAVLELLMRGLCFTDIRLIIHESKIINMAAFTKAIESINWHYYISPDMSLKVKVDVGASPALHEGAMKEKIGEIIQSCAEGETTSLIVDVYKTKLTVSLSLAGSSLYKRGYRSVLSQSAPLREDIAASCIQLALAFAAQSPENYSLLIPFSGTGTFLIEYWLLAFNIAPALFDRHYAIQQMPLFRSEHFNYLLKKAKENCQVALLKLQNCYCIDNAAAANQALLENVDIFKKTMLANDLVDHTYDTDQLVINEDFLKADVSAIIEKMSGNIFIPLNPPYGIRLGQSQQTTALYKNIAKQINAINQQVKQRNNHVAGFILCPDESSWSAFCQTLSDIKMETYHMTQGGLDIRVVQFA